MVSVPHVSPEKLEEREWEGTQGCPSTDRVLPGIHETLGSTPSTISQV